MKTNIEIDNFSNELRNFLIEANSTEEIFNRTSLAQTQDFLPLYFFGNTNQAINVLYAKDNGNTLRVFIEAARRRDNLDQLITGVKHTFSSVKGFLDKNKINFSNFSATIWSEEEEMLIGDYQDFWTKFKSLVPDLPTGIYLSIITIFYSFVQHKVEGEERKWEDVLKTSGINMLLAFLAIILWLIVKTVTSRSNLSFKLKQ